MHSQVNLNNKKTRSIIKSTTNRKTSSSRSNTQEMNHHNRPKNKSSSCNTKKNKNINTSIFNSKNSKEEFPKHLIGLTNINIITKTNYNTNTNTDINAPKNATIYKFKEILNQKDKKITELENQIKLYKDKLKNQIRIFNINSSTNSFNLSKTRSSTNVNERNLYQIQSLSKSHAKIKNSYQIITRNTPKAESGQNFAKNIYRSKNKKRSKSNNYNYSNSNNNLPKPKISAQFFWSKNKDNNIKLSGHVNNFKRSNNFNSSQKSKNKYDDII